jgi:hypothetical protein
MHPIVAKQMPAADATAFQLRLVLPYQRLFSEFFLNIALVK